MLGLKVIWRGPKSVNASPAPAGPVAYNWATERPVRSEPVRRIVTLPDWPRSVGGVIFPKDMAGSAVVGAAAMLAVAVRGADDAVGGRVEAYGERFGGGVPDRGYELDGERKRRLPCPYAPAYTLCGLEVGSGDRGAGNGSVSAVNVAGGALGEGDGEVAASSSRTGERYIHPGDNNRGGADFYFLGADSNSPRRSFYSSI